jgi:hypothetical protein
MRFRLLIPTLALLLCAYAEQHVAKGFVLQSQQQGDQPLPAPREIASKSVDSKPVEKSAKEPDAATRSKTSTSSKEKSAKEPDAATRSKSSTSSKEGESLEVVADHEEQNGDIYTYEGYVIVTSENLKIQADRIILNNVTHDMVAEGNVVYDEGSDQRVTARRAELNTASHRGTFWETTGFTDRTATGEYVFFTADRVVRTGPATYELYNATVTACEDVVPKWSFTSKRAELKIDDRIKLYDSIFRIRGLPFLPLPYTWLPTTKKERKSGFLIPMTGNSNQKGRVFREAYFQTLGDSADLTIRGDIYSQRGIGLGVQFRAQTDDKSYLRVGVYSVKDRLFGPPGPNEGGTAIVGDAIQYLPHGWVAVANVSAVTSLDFRQVFSDDISQVINPVRESTFFAYNNFSSYSFGILADNNDTTIFNPGLIPSTGNNVEIKTRHTPEADFMAYPRRVFGSVPFYFSFDSSAGVLSRNDVSSDGSTFSTPSAVERLDFQPKITIPLPTVGGVAVTASLAERATFYSDSVTRASQALLNQTGVTAPPSPFTGIPVVQDTLPTANSPAGSSLFRHYTELNVDVRPPSFEKVFIDDDGLVKFKHLIEPYITYRNIAGIGDEFNSILKFDERDAVANTNEFEYGFVNRFFITRRESELIRPRRRRFRTTPEMEPEQAGPAQRGPKAKASGNSDESPTAGAAADGTKPDSDGKSQSESGKAKPDATLQSGEQAELTEPGAAAKGKQQQYKNLKDYRKEEAKEGKDGLSLAPGDADDSPVQAYEFLSIKVAQKYFIDRNFGGALVAGARNQFYPLTTLTGFDYAGVSRAFSPVNVSVRYRPLAYIYGDLRFDIGPDSGVRDMTTIVAGQKGNLTLEGEWYYSRQVNIGANSFEPGTFAGSQVFAGVLFGNYLRGIYGGSRIGYDFTKQFLTPTETSPGRLTNTRSFLGYNWDCCGLQFNYNTFKAGLRNESTFSFTFTLAGLGTYGTDQFSQLAGTGGGGGGKAGKRTMSPGDLFP